MAENRTDSEKDASQSLGERFKAHALGPMGLPSIFREISYAITDIRHKWEEAAYGRAITPRWDAHPAAPEASGIHGKADTPGIETPPPAAAPSGDMPTAPEDGGGVHGKAETGPKPDAPAGPGGGIAASRAEMQAEPKGLGMSYAELTRSWAKACAPERDAGQAREPSKELEPGIDR